MASHTNFDDDDDFIGGDFSGSTPTKRSGNKRSYAEREDDEEDIFGNKKGNVKVQETAPGLATGMILSLRESLQDCKNTLATCQTELEAAKAEIQNWHSSFQPFVPASVPPEPKSVVTYLQSLKSSEESLTEKLDKANKKEAAFMVTLAKKEQEVAELKSAVRDLRAQLKPPSMQARRLLLDPAIHEEFTRLKTLVEDKDKKIKELQDNVAAVNFTAQSKMGKMLMAKCRTLQEENEEIGNQANEGKIHDLGMKLALQKTQNTELRTHFEAVCKHMEGLANDVEKSNEMVLVLQDSLEEKDAEIRRLKEELQLHKSSSSSYREEDGEEEAAKMEIPPSTDDNNNNKKDNNDEEMPPAETEKTDM